MASIEEQVRDLYRRLAENRVDRSEIVTLENNWSDSQPHWLQDQLDRRRVTEPDVLPFGRLRAEMGAILDIGAHYGYTAASMRFAGTDCPIISFEAVRANETCLAVLKSLDPLYDYVIGALSDREHEVVLYNPVANDRPITGINSIGGATLTEQHVALAVGAIHAWMPGEEDVTVKLGEYRVTARSLDDVLGTVSLRFPVDTIAAIKLDVEGHEASVLCGAAQMFETQTPLLMIEGGFSNDAVMTLARSYGYLLGERLKDQVRVVQNRVAATNCYFLHPSHRDTYHSIGLLLE